MMKALNCESTARLLGQVRQRPASILLTTPWLNRHGGVSQYMRILQPHWQNAVHYFYIGSRADDESSWATVRRMAADSYRFAKSVKKGNYDVVHLNPSIGPKALIRDGILLLIAKAYRKPVLVFAHGWNPAWAREFPHYVRWLFRFVYGLADGFAVLGTEFECRVRKLGFKKRIFTASAPIADDLWENNENRPMPKEASAKTEFNILFLARVETDKGIYEALDTYRILKQRYGFISLTVAGEGSELRAARQYASSQSLDGVTFVGHVEGVEKRAVFQQAHAYLFPSHHEGLPLSVLEAMAFGLPIVTSDVGSLRDFFEDSVMGFITGHREPEAFASLIERLICDSGLRTRIGSFNRTYARMHFTASQITARFERIYCTLLGRTDPAFLPAR